MGKQVEAGVKFQPNGSPILITAAWFHIEQTNLVTTNPATQISTQSGKVRSEGFEIEASARCPAASTCMVPTAISVSAPCRIRIRRMSAPA
jgi:outer membrane receptor for monomeric catechols